MRELGISPEPCSELEVELQRSLPSIMQALPLHIGAL